MKLACRQFLSLALALECSHGDLGISERDDPLYRSPVRARCGGAIRIRVFLFQVRQPLARQRSGDTSH